MLIANARFWVERSWKRDSPCCHELRFDLIYATAKLSKTSFLRLDEDRFAQVEFPLDAPQHGIIDAAFIA